MPLWVNPGETVVVPSLS